MFPQARKENVLVQEIGSELIIYDQECHRAHRLNPSAALVWNNCNGQTSIVELSKLLQSRFGLPPDEEVAWLALDRLEKANLLQVPVEAATGLSRRKLLRKLGLVGALSLVLPTVTSMVVPTPALAIGYSSVTCCVYTNNNNGNTSTICSPDGGCFRPGPGVTLTSHTARFCDEC